MHHDCLSAACYDASDPKFAQISTRADAEILAYRNTPPMLTTDALKTMNLRYVEPKGVVPWGSIIEALRRGVEDPDGQQPLKRIRYG